MHAQLRMSSTPRPSRPHNTIHIPTSPLLQPLYASLHSIPKIPIPLYTPPTPPSCTAPTPCANRALPPPPRSRPRRLPLPPPSLAGSLAGPTLVCDFSCAESRHDLIAASAGHNFRKSVHPGAFGPDLAKKLSQLVKMEKNVMRSMELVGRERMEVAVSFTISQVL